MLSTVRYLLLQVRNPDDPMAQHEIASFCKSLGCTPDALSCCDLLNEVPTQIQMDVHDILLVGGSGDYSATQDSEWLDRAMDAFRTIQSQRKPMFCSCWGFQAIAKAFGGTVVHDSQLAELGTLPISLTDAGRSDPVFGQLSTPFLAPIGHEDSVIRLPVNCSLLGVSEKANQILRFEDAPIYGTQFHPELDRQGVVDRIREYPRYAEDICHMTFAQFADHCEETPEVPKILPRFVEHVLA